MLDWDTGKKLIQEHRECLSETKKKVATSEKCPACLLFLATTKYGPMTLFSLKRC